MPASRSSLNPAQAAAVAHREGPLLVLAGPGSGKTRVVTRRIAALIEDGVPSSEILAVTFTNKAAREMRKRVRELVPAARAKGLTVATIHSACVRILREEIEAVGYGRDFSIYDEASQQSLARTVLRDLRGSGEMGSASALLSGVEASRGGEPPASGDASRDGFLALAVDRYREELRARNAIDFDDIIALAGRLLEEVPDVAARWRQRWAWLLVDEYQDTNPAQDAVLRALAGADPNLCVVGDDDQSIYGWRGARVELILGFPRRYPGARVVRLEQNYRSSARIVALANAVVARSARRHEKTIVTERGPGAAVRLAELPDDAEEAEFVAGAIARRLAEAGDERRWSEAARHAVLLRTNEQARSFEQALRQHEVPYRVLGGKSFFDRKEVMDVLAYLRVALNPRDEEALFRIVNTPARGVGAATLQAVRDHAREGGESAWTVVADVARGALHAGGLFAPSGPPPLRPRPELAAAVPARAETGLARLVEVIDRLGRACESRSPRLVEDLLESIGYQEEIDRIYRDVQVRLNRWNLALEVQAAWDDWLRSAPRAEARDFVDALALRSPEDDEERGGGVTLTTVHAAKGLEFDRVHVAGCEDGILPHSRSLDDGSSLEEERRLFYVAVTRARDELVLTRALSRQVRGKTVETRRSRFLEDLDPQLLDREDTTAPASEGAVVTNLARLRALGGAD